MQSELIGEFASQVDKKRLVDMLMSNSNNLKGLSIKLSGKAEALEEVVKLIVNGDLDYIDPEKAQQIVEDSMDDQVELINNVNSDSVCEQQEA
jgi:hypothetical protein